MLYYPNDNNNVKYLTNHNDRFILPFLGGALIGGAAVGLTRPRPIYNVAPYYNQSGFVPYGYYSYNYYYPRYY